MNGTEERRWESRLAWAVWFSQEPLDQEWRWIRVRDELTPGFFQLHEGPQGLRELAMIGFPGTDASRQDVIRDLQRETRAVLETAVDQRESCRSDTTTQPHSVSIRGKARVTLQVVASGPRGSRSYLWVTGSTKEVFLTILMVELCRPSKAAVRRCGAPSSTTPESERCTRLFVSVGRQLYCTPACTARAMKARQRSGARRGEARDHAAAHGAARGALRSERPARRRRDHVRRKAGAGRRARPAAAGDELGEPGGDEPG